MISGVIRGATGIGFAVAVIKRPDRLLRGAVAELIVDTVDVSIIA